LFRHGPTIRRTGRLALGVAAAVAVSTALPAAPVAIVKRAALISHVTA
jgi:hypothetical protein